MKPNRAVVDSETDLPIFGFSYSLLTYPTESKRGAYGEIQSMLMCSVTERFKWLGFRPMWRA